MGKIRANVALRLGKVGCLNKVVQTVNVLDDFLYTFSKIWRLFPNLGDFLVVLKEPKSRVTFLD